MTNIFCFPHAGGSAASYKAFANAFPEEIGRVIPIEIPGRGRRSTEPFSDSLKDCVISSVNQINTDAGEYYLHGHCMGALLAFETVKYLESHGRRKPRLLIVSGRNAPHHQTDWGLRVAGLDDRLLFDELSKVGGVPRGLSYAMAQQFLSVIRCDQKIVHSYKASDTRVSVPILVLAGKNDTMTNQDALRQWKDFTTEEVTVKMLEGEHYFIYDQAENFAQTVESLMECV